MLVIYQICMTDELQPKIVLYFYSKTLSSSAQRWWTTKLSFPGVYFYLCPTGFLQKPRLASLGVSWNVFTQKHFFIRPLTDGSLKVSLSWSNLSIFNMLFQLDSGLCPTPWNECSSKLWHTAGSPLHTSPVHSRYGHDPGLKKSRNWTGSRLAFIFSRRKTDLNYSFLSWVSAMK